MPYQNKKGFLEECKNRLTLNLFVTKFLVSVFAKVIKTLNTDSCLHGKNFISQLKVFSLSFIYVSVQYCLIKTKPKNLNNSIMKTKLKVLSYCKFISHLVKPKLDVFKMSICTDIKNESFIKGKENR